MVLAPCTVDEVEEPKVYVRFMEHQCSASTHSQDFPTVKASPWAVYNGVSPMEY